jgi:hypothetical protein
MRKVGAGFAIPTQLTGECSTVTSSEPTEQACFDFRRGIAKNGAYDFASASDFDAATYILRLQVSPMGHINICIPAGEKTMPGYNSC